MERGRDTEQLLLKAMQALISGQTRLEQKVDKLDTEIRDIKAENTKTKKEMAEMFQMEMTGFVRDPVNNKNLWSPAVWEILDLLIIFCPFAPEDPVEFLLHAALDPSKIVQSYNTLVVGCRGSSYEAAHDVESVFFEGRNHQIRPRFVKRSAMKKISATKEEVDEWIDKHGRKIRPLMVQSWNKARHSIIADIRLLIIKLGNFTISRKLEKKQLGRGDKGKLFESDEQFAERRDEENKQFEIEIEKMRNKHRNDTAFVENILSVLEKLWGPADTVLSVGEVLFGIEEERKALVSTVWYLWLNGLSAQGQGLSIKKYFDKFMSGELVLDRDTPPDRLEANRDQGGEGVAPSEDIYGDILSELKERQEQANGDSNEEEENNGDLDNTTAVREKENEQKEDESSDSDKEENLNGTNAGVGKGVLLQPQEGAPTINEEEPSPEVPKRKRKEAKQNEIVKKKKVNQDKEGETLKRMDKRSNGPAKENKENQQPVRISSRVTNAPNKFSPNQDASKKSVSKKITSKVARNQKTRAEELEKEHRDNPEELESFLRENQLPVSGSLVQNCKTLAKFEFEEERSG